MLGRHVYRVSQLATGGWGIQKEGEPAPRETRNGCKEAVAYAAELARADPPSKVIVEGRPGEITDEQLFGEDTAAAIERDAFSGGAKPSGARK